MGSILVETATRESVREADRLLGEQFEEHAIALPPERRIAALEELITAPERGFVLVARDVALQATAETVGLAAVAYTWTLEHGGLVAWLDELYVEPARRGQGIGGALLTHAVESAELRGCVALELEVDAAHTRAANLYRRRGFHDLARKRWSLGLKPPSARAGRSVGSRPYPSIDHVSLGVNDVARSKAFYDAALAPLGLVSYPQADGDIGYGPPGGEPMEGFAFYIGFETPSERRSVAPSAGSHVALCARSRDAVDHFYKKALSAGGRDLGRPGLRARYHSDYYGAFVADPDGHHVEAVCHTPPA